MTSDYFHLLVQLVTDAFVAPAFTSAGVYIMILFYRRIVNI